MSSRMRGSKDFNNIRQYEVVLMEMRVLSRTCGSKDFNIIRDKVLKHTKKCLSCHENLFLTERGISSLTILDYKMGKDYQHVGSERFLVFYLFSGNRHCQGMSRAKRKMRPLQRLYVSHRCILFLSRTPIERRTHQSTEGAAPLPTRQHKMLVRNSTCRRQGRS